MIDVVIEYRTPRGQRMLTAAKVNVSDQTRAAAEVTKRLMKDGNCPVGIVRVHGDNTVDRLTEIVENFGEAAKREKLEVIFFDEAETLRKLWKPKQYS